MIDFVSPTTEWYQSHHYFDRIQTRHGCRVDRKWETAVLTHSAKSRKITVPAGTFEADLLTVSVAGGRKWNFYVEQGGMHRVLKWESDDGELAELVASDRQKYWKMNGARFLSSLKGLGLSPRPPRTP